MTGTGSKTDFDAVASKHIRNAMSGSTTISGGLVLSNLIMARDTKGAVQSGMSGITNDNIGLWTGGTYQQAQSGAAKTILRKDGSGQLAGGNIFWDTDGDLSMKGKVEADSGKIGLFEIINNMVVGRDGEEILNLTTKKISDLSNYTGSKPSDLMINQTNLSGRADGYASGGMYGSSHGKNDARIFNFNLPESGVVELQVAANCVSDIYAVGGYANQQFFARIYIKDTNGKIVFERWSDGTELGNKVLPAGDYVVWGDPAISAGGNVSGEDESFDMTWYCTVTLSSIKVYKNNKEVTLGSTGICIYSNDKEYFYCTKGYGVEFRFGDFGIKCDKNGLYKYDKISNGWANL